MKQSELFTKTRKEAPKDEESINAILLQRAGFIHKEMAGVYSFLPLGLRVLRNIENIVREEMNKIGAQEIVMSILQPKGLWKKTGRWDEGIGKEVMYKTEDGDMGLGPTHEEMLTNIVSKIIESGDDLPFAAYQIQIKFRKEKRAKSGLLRGREFQMKDMYSFHETEEDFKEFYEKTKEAYLNVYKRCGLKAIITEASGGDFAKEVSHEFQVLSEVGEDTILYCEKCDIGVNTEISKDKKCKCGNDLKECKSIEAGNIFTLGTKYSEALDAKVNGKPVLMGCYGIGLSRLMGTVVELFNDDKGIIWPKEIAPFKYHLISLQKNKEAQDIYDSLEGVLYDDRDKSAGNKFADADLIGIPIRIVVSEKTLEKDSVEIKRRNEEKSELVKIKDLNKCLIKY